MGERLHGRVPEGDCLAINWPDTSRPRVPAAGSRTGCVHHGAGFCVTDAAWLPGALTKDVEGQSPGRGASSYNTTHGGPGRPGGWAVPRSVHTPLCWAGPPPDLTSAPCGLGRSQFRPTDAVAGPGPRLCHVTGSHGHSFPQGAATPSAGGPSSGAEHVRAALGTGEGSEGAGGLRLDARGGPRSQPLGLLPLGGGTDATQRAVAAPRWACRDPRGLQPGLGPTGCPSPGMWRAIGRAGSHGRNKQSGVRCYFETH